MKIHDSGSNYQFYDKKIDPNIKRSSFDLSRIRQTTLDLGLVSPVLRLHYMPNSDITISFSSLVRAINVPIVPLGSRQRLFYHLYKLDFAQMWSKWGTFMSKGRNGNAVIPLPKFRIAVDKTLVDETLTELEIVRGTTINNDSTFVEKMVQVEKVLSYLNIFHKGGLLDFLGFPAPDNLIKSLITYLVSADGDFALFEIDVPAFPVFAYLSIIRSYYLNPNLLSSNELSLWFPDSEDDWKLADPDFPDSETWIANEQTHKVLTRAGTISTSFDDSSRFCRLDVLQMRYRNFADDYFTSSLYYPMRGEIPEVDISGIVKNLEIPSPGFQLSEDTTFAPDGSSFVGDYRYAKLVDNIQYTPAPNGTMLQTWGSLNFVQADSSTGSVSTQKPSGVYLRPAPQVLQNAPLEFASGLTWELVRNLSISTIIQEKMARTDGSYIEFVRTFFDQFPSKFSENRPQYVDGDYLPIIYSEVLQQSEDGNTPLGTVGGKGISSGDGYLGNVHCDDFGLLLGVVSILPDTYYSQGWHRQDMYDVQEDFPLPERAELGMQAIYKGEIFFSGNPENDRDLFGYISRYDEWRYAPNEITGKVADVSSLTFFPYTQSRYFYDTPVLSSSFVSTKDNIRRDYLSVYDEVPFYAQFAHKIKVVQPLPYKAVPVGLK